MSGMPLPAPAMRAARPLHGAAMAILVFASGTSGVLAQPISPAEVLLFETDHLARTQAPATLVYEFRKLSNVEPAYTDSVHLEVSRSKGQLHAALRFLSGARMHKLPEVDDAHGNPVLLGFLEHDIAEMRRLTGGSVTYFRKRIRMALAETAQVSAQRINYQGKTVQAKAVRIQPYLDDPMRARFERFVRKTYTFVFSDEVPGGVYQISTSLSNTAAPRPGSVMANTAGGGGEQFDAAQATSVAQHLAGSAAGNTVAATVPGTSSDRVPAGRAGPGTAAASTGRTPPPLNAPGPATGTVQVRPAAAGATTTTVPVRPATSGAATGTAQTGAAASGTATSTAQTGTTASGAATSTAQARPDAPGAGPPGATMPVIDETLTLSKVVSSRH